MNRLSISLLAIITTFYLSGTLLTEKPSLSPKEHWANSFFLTQSSRSLKASPAASCHAPEVGFTGPDAEINKAGAVYEGAAKGRFGNRKPPASSYCGDSPVLHFDKKEKVWVGGMFWDGRATGKRLKDPLAEQAQGPFLNPLEQNIPDSKTICMKIKDAPYASLFEQVWGMGSLDCINNVSATYDKVARSIAAYERSKEANPFSSKYDYWLLKKVKLSAEETRGLKLYEGKGSARSATLIGKTLKGRLRSSPILLMTTSVFRKIRKTHFTECP